MNALSYMYRVMDVIDPGSLLSLFDAGWNPVRETRLDRYHVLVLLAKPKVTDDDKKGK